MTSLPGEHPVLLPCDNPAVVVGRAVRLVMVVVVAMAVVVLLLSLLAAAVVLVLLPPNSSSNCSTMTVALPISTIAPLTFLELVHLS